MESGRLAAEALLGELGIEVQPSHPEPANAAHRRSRPGPQPGVEEEDDD
jgi:hypothetical protein